MVEIQGLANDLGQFEGEEIDSLWGRHLAGDNIALCNVGLRASTRPAILPTSDHEIMYEDDLSRFSESLVRSTQRPQFYDRFYARLIGESEEVGAFFHNRDMQSIIRKLQTTLEMVADSAEGKPGLTMYLEMLGGIHRRLKVEPRFFELWRYALIETVAETDEQFNNEIRGVWERILDQVIVSMHPTEVDE